MQDARNEQQEEENAFHSELLKTCPGYKRLVEKEVSELTKRLKKHDLKTFKIGCYEMDTVEL